MNRPTPFAVNLKSDVFNSSLIDELRKTFGEYLNENVSLRSWTTFHCEAVARAIVSPQNLKDLQKLIQMFVQNELVFGENWRVIGRGSNILVRDGGYPGILIDLSRGFSNIQRMSEDQTEVIVRAEAGVANGTLLAWTREKCLAGFGFTFGIPGSIGGGIRMNAGTPLGCFAKVVMKVEGVTHQGEGVSFSVGPVDFEYRDFPKAHEIIITAGHFCFKRSSPKALEEEIEAAKHLRKNQPLEWPNIGSVFKNPKGEFAAQLIEASGLKGLRIGDAEISQEHCNFIVNVKSAKTKDVIALMNRCQEEVYLKFHVQLEPEVHIIGVKE